LYRSSFSFTIPSAPGLSQLMPLHLSLIDTSTSIVVDGKLHGNEML